LKTERYMRGVRREAIKSHLKIPCLIRRVEKTTDGIEYIATFYMRNLNITKHWDISVVLIDHEHEGAVNDGLIMPFRNDKENRTNIYYIKGHALDRYCERYLKLPVGYKMTINEMIDRIIANLKYVNSSIDVYTREVQTRFVGGTFLGYETKDRNIKVLNTFIAVSNYYADQSLTKKTLDDHYEKMKNEDELKASLR